MAVDTATVRNAALRPPTSPVRGSNVRAREEEQRIELQVRREEAAEFCARLRPRLEFQLAGAISLGPRHYQNVLQCLAWVDSYAAKNAVET